MLYTNLELKPDEIDMVIYHAGCSDGFGGAFCAWLWYKNNKPEKQLIFVPAEHGNKPPDVKGKNVLIVDFTYKLNILDAMMKDARIAILDHHVTAMDDLKTIPSKNKVFDMKHSGVYLAWKYFFPNNEIPELIKLIEARDIWDTKYPYVDEFTCWYSTIDMTFENMEKLLDNKYLMSFITTKGTELSKVKKTNMNNIVKSAIPKFMCIGNKYYMVVHTNTTIYKSDIGNRVLSHYPNADFSVSYSIDDRTNSTVFSLRSTDKHANCSDIAKLYGGGGHRNASGLKLIGCITSTIPGEVLNNGQLYDKLDHIYFDTISLDGSLYNIVYLNTSMIRSKIGKYLLQYKYSIYIDGKSEDGKDELKEYPVQTCRSIEMNRSNDDYLPSIVSIAGIWNYDGSNDETIFSVVFTNDFMDKDKMKNEYNGEYYGDILIVKIKGLVNKLKKN